MKQKYACVFFIFKRNIFFYKILSSADIFKSFLNNFQSDEFMTRRSTLDRTLESIAIIYLF